MGDVLNERKTDVGDKIGTDRRDFMKGAAAGLVGVVGMTALSETVEAQETEAVDPAPPPGLKPGGQPDDRFPEVYEQSVPAGTRVLTQYFSALSRRDIQALAKVFHYPFVSYEGVETVIIKSPEDLIANPPPSLNVTGKGDSFIRHGAYDIMECMKTEIFGPCGVGLSLDWTRYDARGGRLYGCGGIYGVTNNDGKWGIEFMSTIFNQTDQMYEDFDTQAMLTAIHENQRYHALARKNNDPIALAKATSGWVGTYASVDLGSSNSWAVPALAGKPMQPYKIRGVKSRLRVSTTTQEQLDARLERAKTAGQQNMDEFYRVSGGTVGKWYTSLEFPGRRGEGARIIHSSTEKGHVYMGYSRYTADGSEVSESRYLGCELYKSGVWIGSDITACFGQTMYRDRSNDDLS